MLFACLVLCCFLILFQFDVSVELLLAGARWSFLGFHTFVDLNKSHDGFGPWVELVTVALQHRLVSRGA